LMLFGDQSHFEPLLCLLINPCVPLNTAGFHAALGYNDRGPRQGSHKR
jgi:hypothetical protein